MKDRVPASGQAGRIALTEEGTNTTKYYKIQMADNPSSGNEGTALNKANLLTDATFTNIKNYLSIFSPLSGVSNDAVTIDQILNLIGQHGLRFKYGTFNGTCAQRPNGTTTYPNYSSLPAFTSFNKTQTLSNAQIGFAPLILILARPATQYGTPTSAATGTVGNRIYGFSMRGSQPAVWIRGLTYGWCSNGGYTSSQPDNGALITWGNDSVTWVGSCGAYYAVDYDTQTTEYWWQLDDCFNLIGNTYYYLAIG